LVAAGHDVFAQDDNEGHLVWCEAVGASALRGVWTYPDVIVPQPDSLVQSWAGRPNTFLPPRETVELCQAKNLAATVWNVAGLRGPAIPIIDPVPDMLHLAADELEFPFWLRATTGAGANKAIKVTRLDNAYHWIRFWQTRGAEVDWIAEPYLPGRDLAWSSIWYRGDLVACFLRERLEYLYPHLSPEGLTGTPTIARIVHDPAVADVATDAVMAIDAEPHGIFSVDLREDEGGVARPTEINAGRSFTTMGLWSLYDVNFTDLAARLALEEPDETHIDPLPEGLTLSRHIDCGHVFSDVPVYA